MAFPGLDNFGDILSSLPLATQNIAASQTGQGQTQAETGLLQQQATGANLANQRSALQLGWLQQAANGDFGSGEPSPNGQPIGNGSMTPDDIQQHAFSQFAPIPAAPPPGVMGRATAFAMAGQPDASNAIKAQWTAAVQGENQRRQLAATDSYLAAQSVSSAPPGMALETLSRVNPQAAQALEQQYASDTPEQLDADVRAYADHIGAAAHQYSGRPTDLVNGVLVDKVDGKPVIGTDKVYAGLAPADLEKTWGWLGESVTVGDNLPAPRWKTMGYSSQEAGLRAAESAARSPNAAAAGGTLPAAGPPGGNLLRTSTTTPQPATAPPAGPPAAPNPQQQQLRAAFSDPSFRYQPPQVPRATTQEQLAANTETLKSAATDHQAAITALKTSGDEITQASARALQQFQYADSLLSKPDSYWVTGIPGEVTSQLAKLGVNVPAGADRAEIVKSLTQAALQGLKTTYGSKPAMFDVKVNLEQAFPDPKNMSVPQLHATINDYERNLNYDIQSGRLVRPYLANGYDPASFNTWREQYFQRAAGVNPGGTRGAPQQAAQADSGGFIPRKRYVDKAGNSATYLGNGKWQ